MYTINKCYDYTISDRFTPPPSERETRGANGIEDIETEESPKVPKYVHRAPLLM